MDFGADHGYNIILHIFFLDIIAQNMTTIQAITQAFHQELTRA
jgi:hypothetical protein